MRRVSGAASRAARLPTRLVALRTRARASSRGAAAARQAARVHRPHRRGAARTRKWTSDPFAGEIAGGRVHGRGSSDMKGGVAAFVAAAVGAKPRRSTRHRSCARRHRGEEIGWTVRVRSWPPPARRGRRAGRRRAHRERSLRRAQGRALARRSIADGVTAHGSMPDKGDNAVYKAARAVNRLEKFDFGHAGHPVLGKPTINVGTFHGGLNINSVPDRATIEIDLRTVPGIDHAALRRDRRPHGEDDAHRDADRLAGRVDLARDAVGRSAPAALRRRSPARRRKLGPRPTSATRRSSGPRSASRRR